MYSHKKYLFLILLPLLFLSACSLNNKTKVTVQNVKSEQEVISKVAIYGDSRDNHEIHKKIVQEIIDFKPEATFHVGDFVNNFKDKNEWQTVNSILNPLLKISSFYIAAGNHEEESLNYYNNFTLPGNEKWYSLNINNTHFIVLNTNIDLATSSEQYQWLEQDLNKTEKNNFVVVVTHHPFFSVGNHASEKLVFKDDLLNLFNKYKVDIVFSGHDHNYSRFLNNNINYITTGGGGAPLHEMTATSPVMIKFFKSYNYCQVVIEENSLIIKVIDDSNKEIDSLVINKKIK